MVRRTTDGLMRFSSHSDISRTLSMYDLDRIDELSFQIAKKYKCEDPPISWFERKELYDSVVEILATAQAACYASNVVATLPASENLDELRTTLLNRTRWYRSQSDACNYHLDLQALKMAAKLGLTVPSAYTKRIAELTFEYIRSAWQYVRGANTIALCHVSYLTNAECSLMEHVTEMPENPLVLVNMFNRKMKRIDFTADKIVGLYSPAYQEGAVPQQDVPRGNLEYFVFVEDTPPSGRIDQPHGFAPVGDIRMSSDALMKRLAECSLQVRYG